jgi:hypothetical protein
MTNTFSPFFNPPLELADPPLEDDELVADDELLDEPHAATTSAAATNPMAPNHPRTRDARAGRFDTSSIPTPLVDVMA